MTNERQCGPFAPIDESELSQFDAAQEKNEQDDCRVITPVPEIAESAHVAARRLCKRNPDGLWKYYSHDGHLLFAVLRLNHPGGGKRILPLSWVRQPDGVEEWAFKHHPVPRPLLNLNKLSTRTEADVVIVEGEKKVRDAETVFPGLIGITSPGGCNAANAADWSPLAGRKRAIIWPDADDAGQKYAWAVALKLDELGVQNILIIDSGKLADLTPDGSTRAPIKRWDVADALLEGWRPEELKKAAFAHAAPFERGPRYISFSNFTMGPEGLTVTVERGNKKDRTSDVLWVSGAFEFVGRARDPRGEGWARWLRWHDEDGRAHDYAVSDAALHGELAALCSDLASRGLKIATGSSRSHLIRYLNEAAVDKRVTVVTKTGWHEVAGSRVFALPKMTLSAVADDKIIVQGTTDAPFDDRGSLADWQSDVAALVAGQSRPVFAISAGFSGPLLGLLGYEGGGFNFFGQSSRGKTTIAEAAASVWGKGASPGFVRSWRSTANALEAIAAIHTDSLLVLDELGVVDAREASTAAYQLSVGTGKGRSTRDGSLRPSQTWRTMVVSTGELRMSDKLAEGNQRARSGQQVRLIDIPAEAGAGFGVFDHGGADADPKALADEIRGAVRNTFGTAGPEFVRRLIRLGIDECSTIVKASIEEFRRVHAPAGADAQVFRVCDRFGLVAAAGELARDLGVVPWQAGQSKEAARRCFDDWLENRGGKEAGEVQAAISQVRLFIENHGDSRFAPLDDSIRHISNRAGWRKGQGRDCEWWILPETWKSEVAKGFNSTEVARTLRDRGILVPADDGFQAVRKVQGKATRVYVVTANIMGGPHTDLDGVHEFETPPCEQKRA